jgi:hypothetical protein
MQTDRFQPTKSGKFNWNEGLKTVGDTLTGIFRKPDNIVNNTYIQDDKEDEEKDNTMLYVGIGGAVILLVVLIIVLKR